MSMNAVMSKFVGANAVTFYEEELFMLILLTPLLQYAPATEEIIAAQLFHVLSYVT
jgi:hypothetical protein